MKIKGLEGYLKDDVDLTREITYQEYQRKEAAPGNTDHHIEEAYEEYCKVLDQADNNE